MVEYIGVDGCRAGWLVIGLSEAHQWQIEIAPTFRAVWERCNAASLILIDIPIGLRERGSQERQCDREARAILGACRRSSIFPVPCRAALYARDYRRASAINEQRCGRKLSKQSWNIASKIREVDLGLRQNPEAQTKVCEIHPEILFWSLNGGRAMTCNKRTPAGFRERLRVLESHFAGAPHLVNHALQQFSHSEVSPDDILDAFAAALTSVLSKGNLSSIPEKPEVDRFGLPMRMVYWRPLSNLLG